MSACCHDYDSPAFYSETWRKARKERPCCECGTKIKPGDTYQHITGKWDYGIDSFDTCEKCADLRDSLSQVTCPGLGGLQEAHKEYLDYANPPRLSAQGS